MIDYKESSFTEQLIARADIMLNIYQRNPFESFGKLKEENEDDKTNEDTQTATFNLEAFQAICNPDIITSVDNVTSIYNFVRSSQFNLEQNQQFLDERFVSGISKYLLSGQPDDIVERAILILSNLWYHHKNAETPLTNPSIVLQLFDILNHTNISFHNIAMISLINYYEISPQTSGFILHYNDENNGDIFTKLRDYLIIAENKEHIKTGIRFLCHLFKSKENENWSNFLQFLPIIPLILNRSDMENQEYMIYTLSVMIEDDQIFEYCLSNQIHSELSKFCQQTILRQRLAYYLYKCVYKFVKRGYLKAFYKQSIFTSIQGILKIEERHNISSLFYVISILFDYYSETFFENNIHKYCILYAKEGCFDNKIAATICVSKLILFSPDEICDQLAREDCIEILCDALQCFDDRDIIFPLRAFRRLIILNRVLYCNIMIQLDVVSYLILKFDEEMCLESKYPNDQVYQEITNHLKFINDNIKDTIDENNKEEE